VSEEPLSSDSLQGSDPAPLAGNVPHSIVIMGVCGCGKTEVGGHLARLTAGVYLDGDDYHSAENVAKMGRGEPLVDADRWPWLARLREDVIAPALVVKVSVAPVILGCSALRRAYREALIDGLDRNKVCFVHLYGPEELISARMKARRGHYMKAGMIASQLAILERPDDDENFIEVSIEQPPEIIAKNILAELARRLWR